MIAYNPLACLVLFAGLCVAFCIGLVLIDREVL